MFTFRLLAKMKKNNFFHFLHGKTIVYYAAIALIACDKRLLWRAALFL